MDFKSLRKEINSKNASVKEIVSDFFSPLERIATSKPLFCSSSINAVKTEILKQEIK